MVDRRSLGLCIILLCICVGISLGSSVKGEKPIPARLQNAHTQNEDRGQDEVGPKQRPGQDRGGQQRPGQDQDGQQRPGQDQDGQQRPGQDQDGQQRPGQDRGGQQRPDGDQGDDKPRDEAAEGGRPGGRRPDAAEGEEGRNPSVPVSSGRKCQCDCGQIPERAHNSYTEVKGLGHYKYHNKAKNWYAAKRECQKEGAHLAIINSVKERDELLKIYKKLPLLVKNPAVFVGIHDLIEDGQWVTIFDEPLNKTGFADWDQYEPLGKSLQNCGTLQTETKKLHDHECQNELGFLCEREWNYIPRCY